MGKVLSGLLSISKFEPFLVERMDFPGSYPWPKKLFMLDRCFMVQRFALSNGKALLIINTHNSAFDGGVLKEHEMNYLKNFLLAEHDKGNYLLVGGDWNQNPPGFVDPHFNEKSGYENFLLATIAEDFMPEDWNWTYDPNVPTNRSNTAPYNKETTTTTILDFYLSSPNLLTINSKSVNLNFKNSDHQPVLCSIKFK
jgi:endonuclease/exonuclease/phosphatase family metal-dependent hydrolase